MIKDNKKHFEKQNFILKEISKVCDATKNFEKKLHLKDIPANWQASNIGNWATLANFPNVKKVKSWALKRTYANTQWCFVESNLLARPHVFYPASVANLQAAPYPGF